MHNLKGVISDDRMRAESSEYSRCDIIECISFLTMDIQEECTQVKYDVY